MGRDNDFLKRGLIIGLSIISIAGLAPVTNTITFLTPMVACAAVKDNDYSQEYKKLIAHYSESYGEPLYQWDGTDESGKNVITGKLSRVEVEKGNGIYTKYENTDKIIEIDTRLEEGNYGVGLYENDYGIQYYLAASQWKDALNWKIVASWKDRTIYEDKDGIWLTYGGWVFGPRTGDIWREETQEAGGAIGYYNKDDHYIASTGHITNIKIMNENSYKYDAPQNIITELDLPLNYVNPWYIKGSLAENKAFQNYYYIGTVINSKEPATTATGYASLSEDEQAYYKELKTYYNQQLKSYKSQRRFKGVEKYNAKIDLIKKGIRYESKDLPLIYKLITGEKFDYDYWEYTVGITGIDAYEDYSTTSKSVSTKKNGITCKSVNITGGDAKIAQVYKDNSTGRVYIKGLKKGTTTFTIKTTLSDGKTVTYQTKVTINSNDTPINYRTAVNPISYAGYCMHCDSARFLGYTSKFGDFYSIESYSNPDTDGISNQTGHTDIFAVADHPSNTTWLNEGDRDGTTYTSYATADQYYKWHSVDRSGFIRDFVSKTGALDMLKAGKSEFEVYNYVGKKILDEWIYKSDHDLFHNFGKGGHHYSLECYLDGMNMACEDSAAIAAGIAECLGINWFSGLSYNHVYCIVVLDGKLYPASEIGISGVYGGSIEDLIAKTYTMNTDTYSLDQINDVALTDLLTGKVSFTTAGFGMSFYKVMDKLEAGRFAYGKVIDNISSKDDSIAQLKIVIDKDYGLLKAGLGDTRVITFHSSVSPIWNNTANDTISFRYSIPYVEKAYFGSLKVGSTKQLNLINSNWSDWTVNTSSEKVAVISTTGKLIIKGSGTAIITLTSKSINGLSIKVLISTNKIASDKVKPKAGTFYSKNSSVYSEGESQILAGDYIRTVK